MAITKVANTGKPSATTTDAIDTTGATLLIIGTHTWVSAATGASDNKGNTWHALTASGDANCGYARIFYAYDHGGSALVVGSGHTFTITGGGAQTITAAAFAGTDITSAVYERENGGLNASIAQVVACGSVTPDAINELILALYSDGYSTNADLTINSSLTLLSMPHDGANMAGGMAYYVDPNTNPINPIWTSPAPDHYAAAAIAVFKAAAGGPSPIGPAGAIVSAEDVDGAAMMRGTIQSEV
jgi:hypothetical protein